MPFRKQRVQTGELSMPRMLHSPRLGAFHCRIVALNVCGGQTASIKEPLDNPSAQVVTYVSGRTMNSTTMAMSAAWGVKPAQVAKTLSVRAGDRNVLLVTCGDSRLDNKKAKAEVHADVVRHVVDEFPNAVPFLAEQIGEGAVDLDLRGGIRPVAELVLENFRLASPTRRSRLQPMKRPIVLSLPLTPGPI